MRAVYSNPVYTSLSCSAIYGKVDGSTNQQTKLPSDKKRVSRKTLSKLESNFEFRCHQSSLHSMFSFICLLIALVNFPVVQFLACWSAWLLVKWVQKNWISWRSECLKGWERCWRSLVSDWCWGFFSLGSFGCSVVGFSLWPSILIQVTLPRPTVPPSRVAPLCSSNIR